MWLLPGVLFWGAFGLVGYTYVGYPLLIWGLSRLRRRPVLRADSEPTVTVVMAAHDEADDVARKLDGLLALDYPADKLRVVVVDDASTDATAQLVAGYVERGVVLVRQPTHGGKAAAINAGVAHAKGELLLFCDVRQRVDPQALRALLPAFGDPTVGAVSGTLHLDSAEGPGVYWRYERFVREAEARFDSVVGATGAWYAIRRELFQPLPPNTLLDDVFTPMQIVLAGYRVLLEPTALTWDVEAKLSHEFRRKVRTLTGNFQLVKLLPALKNPFKNRLWLQLVSHKLLRLAAPYALVVGLGATIALVAMGAPGWPFYVAALAAQGLVYGLALKGRLAPKRAGRAARICHTFVTLNLAAVEAARRYALGELSWDPAERAARRSRRPKGAAKP